MVAGSVVVRARVTGPWQVTAQPDSKAEFNAAVKTSVGTVKFELIRVESATYSGDKLTIIGGIKVKYKGYSFIFDTGTDPSGTQPASTIEVDLSANTMTLNLWSSTSINLVGTVKTGGAHP